MDNISPIAEPYARLARLYTSQNGDPINDTMRMIFSSVIQNALVCKITLECYTLSTVDKDTKF